MDSLSSSHLAVGVGLIAFVGILSWKADRNKGRNPRRLPYPPGPKGLPLLGNALQFPLLKPWEVFTEWRATYGDILYLTVLDAEFLVLNSHETISYFLEKNNANTSNRPQAATSELTGMSDFQPEAMQYGPKWRTNRKALHQCFNAPNIRKYHPILEEETTAALQELLHLGPGECSDWTRRVFGKMLMRAAYGLQGPAFNKEILRGAEDYVGCLAWASAPGNLLVNFGPFEWLRYVPSSRWIPGTAWKRKLEAAKAMSKRFLEEPFADAREQIAQGLMSSEYHSVVAELVSALPDVNDPSYAAEKEVAQNVAATVFAAGVDPSVIQTHVIFLALAMYPDVQRRMQEEIDSVTDGGARLPSISDRPRMPYLQAVVKELTRWFIVTPLGVPHETEREDELNGYYVPGKTIIMPNLWAVFRDPAIYEEPHKFKPERFLESSEGLKGEKIEELRTDILDPYTLAFGFGRRICPGRFLAFDAMALIIMKISAVFDIRPRKDAKSPLRLDLVPDASLSPKPLPFEVDILPRSEKHLSLIS